MRLMQVSLVASTNLTVLAGLGVSLVLGGVANGVAPRMWSVGPSHPVLWLDHISYTR